MVEYHVAILFVDTGAMIEDRGKLMNEGVLPEAPFWLVVDNYFAMCFFYDLPVSYAAQDEDSSSVTSHANVQMGGEDDK